MLKLTALDYAMIVVYFIVVISVGFFLRKKASKNLFSFFVANREYHWFWIGTSMVATTFSADTPLAVSGITANQGISGNWFWWSWILTYMSFAIFYSKFWWRSKIITDVEFTELRYSGKEAAILRFIKAFYFSILLNGIILGWVFHSLYKILYPIVDLSFSLDWFVRIYPEFLVMGNYHQTFVSLVLIFVVVLYASFGGIRSGISNDALQFVVAMGGSLYFAFFALSYVGGSEGLISQIKTLYPDESEQILSFFPNSWDALSLFLIYFGVQWWTQYYSDGTGYLVQRMNTAKTEKDAQLSVLWFSFANFVIRTWPWVVIGLVGLVLYPKTNCLGDQLLCQDREFVYPVMMFELLPEGLRGFLFLGLIAAFMSTAETHLNWGASYIANDFYKRFFRPNASEKELVWVSKWGIVLMAILGIVFSSQMETISGAWKFLIAISAGIGLPQMLRWIWWRINAWSEISGMISSLVLTLLVYLYLDDLKPEYQLILVAIGSVIISLVVTLLTKPTDYRVLAQFVEKVQPYGFWKPYMGSNKIKPLIKDLILWVLGNISILMFMLSIGYFIFSQYVYSVLYVIGSVISGLPVIVSLVFNKNS